MAGSLTATAGYPSTVSPTGRASLSLVEHRFGGQGLYLLDEPEAALSPRPSDDPAGPHPAPGGAGTPSSSLPPTPHPDVLSGACIYQLSEAGITQVDYRDTEHYQLTRRFLEAPEQMMELLFQEL